MREGSVKKFKRRYAKGTSHIAPHAQEVKIRHCDVHVYFAHRPHPVNRRAVLSGLALVLGAAQLVAQETYPLHPDTLDGVWQGYDGEWRHVSNQLVALAGDCIHAARADIPMTPPWADSSARLISASAGWRAAVLRRTLESFHPWCRKNTGPRRGGSPWSGRPVELTENPVFAGSSVSIRICVRAGCRTTNNFAMTLKSAFSSDLVKDQQPRCRAASDRLRRLDAEERSGFPDQVRETPRLVLLFVAT